MVVRYSRCTHPSLCRISGVESSCSSSRQSDALCAGVSRVQVGQLGGSVQSVLAMGDAEHTAECHARADG